MRKKFIFTIMLIILTFIMLSLFGCSKTDKIDESDNNVKPVTIENLGETLRNNPYQYTDKIYFENGKHGWTTEVKYGKNAQSQFTEQIGLHTFHFVTVRRPNFNTYKYSKKSYTIDEALLLTTYKTREIFAGEYDYSSQKIANNFDELLAYNKNAEFSGFFFYGYYEYLVEKGNNIYQVDQGKITEFGQLAADSYGAKGVQYITESAKSLKITILKNNEIELSYYFGDNLTEIRITNIGKNYIVEDEIISYCNDIDKTGKTFYWSEKN